MSLKSDQRMELWIFCDVILWMIWLRFLLVHGGSGNLEIFGKEKTDRAVSPPPPLNKIKKILSEDFPQTVLSGTDESLEVVLLPGIFLFCLIF